MRALTRPIAALPPSYRRPVVSGAIDPRPVRPRPVRVQLDSTVDSIVNAIWFNQGQVCCAGSRLLVQEDVQGALIEKLKRKLSVLRVGASGPGPYAAPRAGTRSTEAHYAPTPAIARPALSIAILLRDSAAGMTYERDRCTRAGNSLDKCIDVGAVVDKSQYDSVQEYIRIAR